MKIAVGNNTFIESDTRQFIVKKYTGAIDKEGNEISTSLGYYNTLGRVIKGLVKTKLLESEATTIKELLETLNRIEKEIDDLIKV